MSRTQPQDLLSFLGVGLRPHHYPDWHASDKPPLLEVMSDNYLFQAGGPGLYHLQSITEKTEVVLHGVGLNIGSSFPLCEEYMRELAKLSRMLKPSVVSDHLCFTSAPNGQSYDLLPVPRSLFNARKIAERVARVQDILGCRLSLENVSSYVSYEADEMSEAEFLNEISARAGSGILLDVNNVYVSAYNHDYDALAELRRYKAEHITQFHVAGHSDEEGYLHDTHDQPVKPEVWALMGSALALFGARPTILERDDEQALEPLIAELMHGSGLLKERLQTKDSHDELAEILPRA